MIGDSPEARPSSGAPDRRFCGVLSRELEVAQHRRRCGSGGSGGSGGGLKIATKVSTKNWRWLGASLSDAGRQIRRPIEPRRRRPADPATPAGRSGVRRPADPASAGRQIRRPIEPAASVAVRVDCEAGARARGAPAAPSLTGLPLHSARRGRAEYRTKTIRVGLRGLGDTSRDVPNVTTYDGQCGWARRALRDNRARRAGSAAAARAQPRPSE